MAKCEICGKKIKSLFSDVVYSDDMGNTFSGNEKGAIILDGKSFESCGDCVRSFSEITHASPDELHSREEAFLQRAITSEVKEYIKREYDRIELERERLEQQKKNCLDIRDIPVTTADIEKPYQVIGPVIFNTTNRGVFSSAYSNLKTKYLNEPFCWLIKKPTSESAATNEAGTFFLSLFDSGLGYEGSVGQGEFDNAFYYAVAEMKIRCVEMGGNAIVGLRMDFDLDTTNMGAFYLQMYGTVVRIL